MYRKIFKFLSHDCSLLKFLLKLQLQHMTQVSILTGISVLSVVSSPSLSAEVFTLKPTCECRPPELHLAFIFGRLSMLKSADKVRSHSRRPDSVPNSEFGRRDNGLFPIRSRTEAPIDLPTYKRVYGNKIVFLK